MLCRHYMLTHPSTVLDTDPLSDALQVMVRKHHQEILVVTEDGRWAGELTSFVFSRLLMPADAGEGPTAADVALAETAADVDNRLLPYLGRPVADFADKDIPTVEPDTPLTDALRHLSKGILRLPVVEGPDQKLVGALSSLTILRRFQF
ncbi:MAG: CBS domain-containing protein [Rhodospirillaceae bacterium]|nr:CBS domain-containing protein [Rhodospirillaceae bacterium]